MRLFLDSLCVWVWLSLCDRVQFNASESLALPKLPRSVPKLASDEKTRTFSTSLLLTWLRRSQTWKRRNGGWRSQTELEQGGRGKGNRWRHWLRRSLWSSRLLCPERGVWKLRRFLFFAFLTRNWRLGTGFWATLLLGRRTRRILVGIEKDETERESEKEGIE